MTTEVPPEAIQVAAKVRLRQYDSEFNASHLSWHDFTAEVTEELEAAAPLIITRALHEADLEYGRERITEVNEAVAAERARLAQSQAARFAREFVASDDLMSLVRAEPACSRDKAMDAVGGLIGTLRLVLDTIGDDA